MIGVSRNIVKVWCDDLGITIGEVTSNNMRWSIDSITVYLHCGWTAYLFRRPYDNMMRVTVAS